MIKYDFYNTLLNSLQLNFKMEVFFKEQIKINKY